MPKKLPAVPAPAASIQCPACPARRNGLCSELSSPELQQIEAVKSCDRQVLAGKDIFAPGTSDNEIYNLLTGWAFRYIRLEDGRRQILDFLLPGAMIGFQPGPKAKASYGAQALTDTTVCVLPHDGMVAFANEVPKIGLHLASMLSRDQSLAYDHLMSIGKQSAHRRVARLILELFVRYHTLWPDQQIGEMRMPLTQDHIGDALGLTGIHVNRVLRDLRESGVFEFRYKRLYVLSFDKLITIAETDQHLMTNWTHTGARTYAAPRARR